MTREDIIRMAREAGAEFTELPRGDAWLFAEDEHLELFASLVSSAAIKESLAQPEQEPVALVYDPITGSITPLQRTWVEIDGDDWIKALEMADFDTVAAFEFFEAKLKELNT